MKCSAVLALQNHKYRVISICLGNVFLRGLRKGLGDGIAEETQFAGRADAEGSAAFDAAIHTYGKAGDTEAGGRSYACRAADAYSVLVRRCAQRQRCRRSCCLEGSF